MSGINVDKNYVGYEFHCLKNDKSLPISEVMEMFLEFVKEYEPDVYEKSKIMIGDFLSDNKIPPQKLLAENEILMLDRWIKSVKGE